MHKKRDYTESLLKKGIDPETYYLFLEDVDEISTLFLLKKALQDEEVRKEYVSIIRKLGQEKKEIVSEEINKIESDPAYRLMSQVPNTASVESREAALFTEIDAMVEEYLRSL